MDIHLKPIVNLSVFEITGRLRRFAELDIATQVVGWAAQMGMVKDVQEISHRLSATTRGGNKLRASTLAMGARAGT